MRKLITTTALTLVMLSVGVAIGVRKGEIRAHEADARAADAERKLDDVRALTQAGILKIDGYVPLHPTARNACPAGYP